VRVAPFSELSDSRMLAKGVPLCDYEQDDEGVYTPADRRRGSTRAPARFAAVERERQRRREPSETGGTLRPT
jgi:hypothetical protein